MRADRRRADHVEAHLACSLRRLVVEVVEHFKMVGQETDRSDDDVGRALRAQ